jgi:hypothetical protein
VNFNDALARALWGTALEEGPRRGHFVGPVLDLSEWIGQALLVLSASAGNDGIQALQVLKPTAVETTFTSDAISLAEFLGTPAATLNCVKSSGGTAPTLEVEVWDCATLGGTYAATTLHFTQVTDAADLFETIQLDRELVLAFVKFKFTVADAEASFLASLDVSGQLAEVTGTPTLDVAVHHCDTEDGTFVASGKAFAQVSAEESHEALSFDVEDFKQFIRLVGDADGGEFRGSAGLVGLKRSLA